MKAKAPRPNTHKARIFKIEQINDLTLDVFYDHQTFSPARVRLLLEEFGVVSALAPDIVRIDLFPSEKTDLVVAYLSDFTSADASNAYLYKRNREN